MGFTRIKRMTLQPCFDLGNMGKYLVFLGISFLFGCSDTESNSPPQLIRKIQIPEIFLVEGPEEIIYGGDIRVGDLTGNGKVDFIA